MSTISKSFFVLMMMLFQTQVSASEDTNVTVFYEITSQWSTGFQGVMTLQNKGPTLSHWKLQFNFIPGISSIWDASIVGQTGSQYQVEGPSWNTDLPSQTTASFGFISSTGDIDQLPFGCQINGQACTFVNGTLPSVTPTPSPTPTITPTPTPTPTATPPVSGNCAAVWDTNTVYNGGDIASYEGLNYKANWWTQGQNPVNNSGPIGSGKPWTVLGVCGTNPTPSPSPSPSPSPTVTPTPEPTSSPVPPVEGFIFSPYKDITINMNWNTTVISTAVTGTMQPILNVMPNDLKTLTWAFATGECGKETWGGLTPSALVAANLQAMVQAGKYYIISTGGAAGAFTCSTDSGFEAFIKTYYSQNLLGIDFDIEAGQSLTEINQLIQRVKFAQAKYPHLRFSFTLATLGGNSPQSLGSTGVQVMNAIKSAALTNYTVNLMVMDYGSPIASNCVLSNGQCDMGQSAIQAVKNLNSYWGVPYEQIEVTPMIGGNDVIGETFTLANANTMTAFALEKHLAGIHFWSLDRDRDCAPGYASPICNSYGQSGVLGFTRAFINLLGAF